MAKDNPILMQELQNAAMDLQVHLYKEALKWLNEQGFAKSSDQALTVLLVAVVTLEKSMDMMAEGNPEWLQELRRRVRG